MTATIADVGTIPRKFVVVHFNNTKTQAFRLYYVPITSPSEDELTSEFYEYYRPVLESMPGDELAKRFTEWIWINHFGVEIELRGVVTI